MADPEEMNERLIDFAESPNCRFWSTELAKLAVPEVVFGLVWDLESEVNNGGSQQYFHNGSGALAPYVVEALRTIGAAKTADLASRAFEVVGAGVPWSEDEARRAKIASLPTSIEEALDALDQDFYTRPDDLTALLYKYACDHRQALGVPDSF
jgi:Domain of unknown function (DUF4375)